MRKIVVFYGIKKPTKTFDDVDRRYEEFMEKLEDEKVVVNDTIARVIKDLEDKPE